MGKIMVLKSVLVAVLGLAAALPAIRTLHAQDMLKIDKASYGYAGERKDVSDDVVKLCDGKATCKFPVKNETFAISKGPADPSPGNDKGVMVFWKCGTTAHKQQFAEGRTASVDCDPLTVVPAPQPK
jgi:membrane-bound inhibitor of C-type lysozyme